MDESDGGRNKSKSVFDLTEFGFRDYFIESFPQKFTDTDMLSSEYYAGFMDVVQVRDYVLTQFVAAHVVVDVAVTQTPD